MLIYLKLNWAKVAEAINYRRTLFRTGSLLKKRTDDDIEDDNDGEEEEHYARKENYVLDPAKLAEIFENDDLSREEIFDPRYRYIYICGGTLISDNMILTAAHCMTDLKGNLRASKDFMVVLGGISNDFYENLEEPKAQIIPVCLYLKRFV